MPAKMAIMAITTNNSMSVNASAEVSVATSSRGRSEQAVKGFVMGH
jgi:hypothetical protein